MPLLNRPMIICGIPEVAQHSSDQVTHVLSVISPADRLPPALAEFLDIDHEVIRFHDVLAEGADHTACSQEHIGRILRFGERAHAAPGSRMLIHCHSGVSRSTAAAAILMAQYAPGREEEAFLRLMELRGWAWPNTRMIEIADQLLERNGRLLSGLLAYRRALLRIRPHYRDLVLQWRRSELPE